MELNKKHLSQDQFDVTQNCGTEPPFSGELLYEKRDGIYSCVVCDFALFESEKNMNREPAGQVFMMLLKILLAPKKIILTV